MKIKDLKSLMVGKTVKSVKCNRSSRYTGSDYTGDPFIEIDEIVFTDGSKVGFSAVDQGYLDPAPEIFFMGKERQ